jgi:fimbrial chaperone protein
MHSYAAKIARRLAGGVLLLLTIGPVFAGSIAVNPIRVKLSATQASSALVVRNSGTEPTVVQLQVLEWSQQDGTDVHRPTKDLLATPPIFTVPPGGSQTVRVGLRQRTATQIEGSYRLILQEVPPPKTSQTSALQVALRLSVPVFVAPVTAASASLAWRANLTSKGELKIAADNTGNVHVQVLRFKLSSDGAELAPTQPADTAYILPGQSRAWILRFASVPAAGTALRIEAQTDAGNMRADVVVSES